MTKHATSTILAALFAVPATMTAAADSSGITYRPPVADAAPMRSIEEHRGPGDRPLPSVAVLAPDHAGWTATDQPTLAFYQGDEGEADHIEVAVTPIDSFEPIVELTLPAQPGEGIREVRLADHSAKLDPSKDYEWTVSAVAKNADGNRVERTARAGIRYEPGRAIQSPATPQPDTQRAIAMASGGVWYDAIAALTKVIVAGGEEAVTAHRLRAQLLRQVDLGMAADFDARLVAAGPIVPAGAPATAAP